MPQRRADAVSAGVAAADHDDVLALRVDVVPIFEIAVLQTLGIGGKTIHCEMDSVQLPPRNRDITRPGRPGSQ